MKLFALFFILICSCTGNELQNAPKNRSGFPIIRNQWDHVKVPYLIVLWVLIIAVARGVFSFRPKLFSYLPDSSLMIIFGILMGLIMNFLGISKDSFAFSSKIFFLYLLPSIIFDAGYFMPNRAFLENFRSIGLFALVGTVWNAISIGTSLYALSLCGWFSVEFSLLESLLFSSLLAACDPVAVIAVFEELHVNSFLFVNVFGEALFNDAISVVLYNLLGSVNEVGIANFETIDYMSAAVSFLVVSLGGIFFGIAFGLIASFCTKVTDGLHFVSPIFVFIIPYLAYLTAESWAISSIITIAVCGMIMQQYVIANLGERTAKATQHFVKLVAQAAEMIVFLFLGLCLISSEHYWDLWFILTTIGLCLVFRMIGVLIQCAFLNQIQSKKFTLTDQCVLFYGGIRGPIAFGLVTSMPDIPAKGMFLTTTLCVIYFTIFIQGTTIQPLLSLLKIETGVKEEPSDVSFNKFYEATNKRFLKPIFTRKRAKKSFDESMQAEKLQN